VVGLGSLMVKRAWTQAWRSKGSPAQRGRMVWASGCWKLSTFFPPVVALKAKQACPACLAFPDPSKGVERWRKFHPFWKISLYSSAGRMCAVTTSGQISSHWQMGRPRCSKLGRSRRGQPHYDQSITRPRLAQWQSTGFHHPPTGHTAVHLVLLNSQRSGAPVVVRPPSCTAV
jgi:hypothetical protein